jgi:hypothetical protein
MGAMNKEFNFRVETKMFSALIPDIFRIPVNSPRVFPGSMRFDDFPEAYPVTGRFSKYRVKPACWATQGIYFGILINSSNF